MQDIGDRITKLKAAAPKLSKPKLAVIPGRPDPEKQKQASIENCGVRLNNALAKGDAAVALAEALAKELENLKKF